MATPRVRLAGGTSGRLDNVPSGGGMAVQAGQGVSATRTTSGSESSFTTTTLTLPASAKPTKAIIAVSASSAQYQSTSIGKRFFSGLVTPNQPGEVDLSGLPPGTTVDIQTEGNAVQVISIVVGYRD